MDASFPRGAALSLEFSREPALSGAVGEGCHAAVFMDK
jgi:hypothetical protein